MEVQLLSTIIYPHKAQLAFSPWALVTYRHPYTLAPWEWLPQFMQINLLLDLVTKQQLLNFLAECNGIKIRIAINIYRFKVLD